MTHETEVTTTIRWTPAYQDADGEWRGSDVLDSIVEAAGRQLLAEIRGDINYDRVTARNTLQRKIDEHVESVLDEALHRALQPTNDYGVPRGEPKEMTEIILDQIEQFLRRASSSNYDRDSLVGQHLKKQVEAVVKKQLNDTLNKAVAEVQAAVQAEGARMLGATLAKLAKDLP